MAQRVKRLPNKCEDKSLIPGVHVKTEQAQHPIYSHGAWGQRQGILANQTENNQGRHLTSSSGFHAHNCKHMRAHVCTLHTGPCKGKGVDSINLKTHFKTKRTDGSAEKAVTQKVSLKMLPN